MKFRLLEDKKPLSYYINKEHPLYEDLLSLIRTNYDSIYEGRANTEYVVNDITGKLIKTGRVNLVGYELRGDDDIVELARLIGNRKFETARILYVKDDKIVGQDATTIDMPNLSFVHPDKNDIIAFAKIKQKMERLGADGYYLVHNHPSGNSTVSSYDIKSCKHFKNNLPGLIAGIVVGDDNYSIINVNGQEFITKKGDFVDKRKEFRNADAVIQYIKQFDNDEDSSFVIYADNYLKLISVQKILNKEFRDKNIFSYIANEKHKNGAVSCFLCTHSNEIYEDACKYTSAKSLFDDTFLIQDNLYKSAVSEYDNLGMVVKNKDIKKYKL